MFYILNNIRQVNFGQLMDVYSEANRERASDAYAHMERGQGILEAEQEFYAFLREFFRLPGAYLALWAPDGVYKAALRIEPYEDGVLIEGVETAPDSRRQGHGAKLLQETVKYLKNEKAEKIYSHIARDNIASVRLHRSCGFEKLLDHAVYVDGSVNRRADTYVYVIKK